MYISEIVKTTMKSNKLVNNNTFSGLMAVRVINDYLREKCVWGGGYVRVTPMFLEITVN